MLDSWIIAGTLALCSVESAVWSQLEQHASRCLPASPRLLLSATCLLFIDRCVCHSFFYTLLTLDCICCTLSLIDWRLENAPVCDWCPAPGHSGALRLVVFRFYNYVHLLAIRIVYCRWTFRQSVKICNQALSQFCGQSSLARYNHHRLCDAASSWSALASPSTAQCIPTSSVRTVVEKLSYSCLHSACKNSYTTCNV